MEMDTADPLEEQLRLAGVPPCWGELDLSQLRSPPPPSPPRTAPRRSRRRLSGVLPCSSHRMTLRRRSGVAPLSPVERSLDALRLGDGEPEQWRLTPSPAPAPVNASPPPPAQTAEEPASARRSGRRRSLVPLNAPPPPASGRKSRRRSFGGRGVSERADGGLLDATDLTEGTGKENGWLNVREGRASPSPTGLKRSLATFEAESLGVAPDQCQGQGAVAESVPEAGPVPGDGTGTGVVRTETEDQAVVPDPAPVTEKPRRPAASRRQRRRSAGGALMTHVTSTTVTPEEAGDGATGDRAALGPAVSVATTADSAGENMDTAVTVTSAADTVAAAPAIAFTTIAPVTTATAAAATAEPPKSSTKPAEIAFRLPRKLEEYYTNRNYEPPAESSLPTIAEEEAPAPARPVRAARRRADGGKVRKCTMELTPAKQRLRKLKAQRVNSLNKARSRKGRPASMKMKKLLDATLKELDLFHQEEERREREEAAAAAAGAASETEGEDRVTEEPMDVETALPSPPPSEPPPGAGHSLPASPCPAPPPPSSLSAPSPPPSAPPVGPPAPLPAPLPDLDATWRSSPARTSLGAHLGEISFSSSGGRSSTGTDDLLLELTRSSADSSLSYKGCLPDGPAVAGAPSPVIVGGGEFHLAAFPRPAEISDSEESASPCIGGRLNSALLLSPDV